MINKQFPIFSESIVEGLVKGIKISGEYGEVVVWALGPQKYSLYNARLEAIRRYLELSKDLKTFVVHRDTVYRNHRVNTVISYLIGLSYTLSEICGPCVGGGPAIPNNM